MLEQKDLLAMYGPPELRIEPGISISLCFCYWLLGSSLVKHNDSFST